MLQVSHVIECVWAYHAEVFGQRDVLHRIVNASPAEGPCGQRVVGKRHLTDVDTTHMSIDTVTA